MKIWSADHDGADEQAAAARFALILGLTLVGVFGLYFGALYLITH